MGKSPPTFFYFSLFFHLFLLLGRYELIEWNFIIFNLENSFWNFLITQCWFKNLDTNKSGKSRQGKAVQGRVRHGRPIITNNNHDYTT